MHHHHSFDLFGAVAGAAVRGVVYQTEHRLFHGMNTSTMIMVGVAVIGVVWLLSRRR